MFCCVREVCANCNNKKAKDYIKIRDRETGKFIFICPDCKTEDVIRRIPELMESKGFSGSSNTFTPEKKS